MSSARAKDCRVRLPMPMMMPLRPSLRRRPGALAILLTTLAATDLAYRFLLRPSVRRALGMGR